MFRQPIPQEEYALALGQFAYIWGMPAVISATLRLNLTQPPPDGEQRPAWDYGAELNQLGGATALATAADHASPGYNNDVLSSAGFFDLAGGPFVIVTPDFGDRYWVVMVADMYGDVVGNVGAYETGSSAPPVFLIGPTWDGELPDGAKIVMRVPTRYVMVANRIAIGSSDDVVSARALQRDVDVIPLRKYLDDSHEEPTPPQRPLKAENTRVPDDLAFFEALGNIIMEQPPRSDEQFAVYGVLRELHITPENGFAYDELDPATKVGMRRGVNAGQELIDYEIERLGREVNGWQYNLNTGRSGNNFLLRAALAVQSPFSNVCEEAVSFACYEDTDGKALSGANAYVLRFEPGEHPPVNAFWSVTLYDADGHFVPNEIDRYAIGDRTSGLQSEEDGTLQIRVQREQPDEAANWLPAPEGEFYLQLRCYVPQSPILSGAWAPPALHRVE